MSLVKLPFLVAVGLGAKLTYTPPNQPQQTEIMAPTYMEMFINNFAAAALPIIRTTIICAALAEAVTVVLPRIPASQLPEFAPKLLKMLGGPDKPPITPAFVAGSTLVGLGGLGRWQCHRTLGRFFTFQLSVRKDHRLITNGPYSIVRHPSYTAALSTLLGVTIFFGSPDSWLRRPGVLGSPLLKACAAFWFVFKTVTIIGVPTRCPQEDHILHKQFGKEWEDWARRVKYWIIPGIY